jgi:hypothetical protein
MKGVIIGLVVVLVVLVGVGFWQGWFQVEKTRTDDGKTHLGIVVDKDKFKQDKEKLKKAAGERSEALKARLAGLRHKAKGLSGADKERADKEIDDLAKKHEALEAKMKDIDEASEEKLKGLKKDISSALEDPAKGADREEGPPR